jgi:hypothetical protein
MEDNSAGGQSLNRALEPRREKERRKHSTRNVMTTLKGRRKMKTLLISGIVECVCRSESKYCTSKMTGHIRLTLLVTVTGCYSKKRPMHCGNFLTYSALHLSSDHSRFNHQSSLLWLQQTPSSEAGRNWARNDRCIFPISQYLSHYRVILHAIKSYDMGPTALFPLRRKSCDGFLSPLKIHRSRPGLNPRTLGPMASTITRERLRRTSVANLCVYGVRSRISQTS